MTSATYTYDPLGRRVAKTVNGSSTYYLSDGTEEVLEFNASGTVTRRYVFGPGVDEPIVMWESSSISNSNRRFFRADPQGSIIALTDQNGNAVETYTYSAYGEPDDPSGQPIRYTGRRWDAETGLYYYRARYYNPSLGRFLQTDPVGYGDNVNMYSYGTNDPMNGRDPTGKWFGLDDAIAAGVGALVGVVAQAAADVYNGEASSWQTYAGAAVGGAAAGETLLYTANPIAAGAVGAGTSNLVTQGLNLVTGEQEEFNVESLVVDTAIGAATGGLLKGVTPKVAGITSGSNSFRAVTSQVTTKAQEGTISSISASTAAKAGVAGVTAASPEIVAAGPLTELADTISDWLGGGDDSEKSPSPVCPEGTYGPC